MTSRERVLTAFAHQVPDRTPLDFAGEPEVCTRLIDHLGLADREALLRRLGVDFRHLDKWQLQLPKYVGPEPAEHPDGTIEDMWGVPHRKVEYRPGCFYMEPVDPPLAGAESIADIERHRWPDPDCCDMSDLAEYCRRNTEHCLAAGIGATFDCVWLFRGMEQSMLDIYDNPGLVDAIVQKLFEFKYEYNRRALEAAEGRLDVLFVSEDMGGQTGLIVGKDTLKRHVFPQLEKFAELGHTHGARVMLHCDGAIREIIPDLIDLGIDILNPVQYELEGMDAAGLKRDFGDRLCFHGPMDSQELLPFGTPDDIAGEVRRLIDVMGADGGLAIAPSNYFQVDVPDENILALYDAVTGPA